MSAGAGSAYREQEAASRPPPVPGTPGRSYLLFVVHRKSAVIGVISKLVQQNGEESLQQPVLGDGAVQIVVDRAAFPKAAAEKLGEGGGACVGGVPGIGPYLMVGIQTSSGVLYLIRNQLLGSNGFSQEDIFHECDFVLLFAVGVRQGPAAEPDCQNGAVNHSGSYLIVVFISKRIISLIDAVCKETGNELGFQSV